MVADKTARKWAQRYRDEGPTGMNDRSSRPHRSPNRTTEPMVRRIAGLRWRHRLGPVQIAGRLGMPASTVHAVLVRCRINHLSRIDRVTGEPLRRYEHPHPGSLIHVDVTKFGNIPDGGGHRFVGRQQGDRDKRATPGPKGSNYLPRNGKAFLHTVIDDHSRVAYAEIHADERGDTATSVLRRAVTWFREHGVVVERVVSDNGPPTAPTPGATPAPNSASHHNAHAPTGRRPTARVVWRSDRDRPDPHTNRPFMPCSRRVDRFRSERAWRTAGPGFVT